MPRDAAIGGRGAVLRPFEPSGALRDDAVRAGIDTWAKTAIGFSHRPQRFRQDPVRPAKTGEEAPRPAHAGLRPNAASRTFNCSTVARHHGIGSSRRHSAS